MWAFVILFGFSANAKETVTVKSNSSVTLSYDEFQTCRVQIKNTSATPFDVSVENASSKEWIRGFGLAAKARVFVDVSSEQVLILTNSSEKDIEVVLDFVERKTASAKKDSPRPQSITFTLHNSSAKSIPLVIPSVMNPSLSPFSDSGVRLRMGQKVYYRKRGKRKLLLIVDETIKGGDKIDVAKLIRTLESQS